MADLTDIYLTASLFFPPSILFLASLLQVLVLNRLRNQLVVYGDGHFQVL